MEKEKKKKASIGKISLALSSVGKNMEDAVLKLNQLMCSLGDKISSLKSKNHNLASALSVYGLYSLALEIYFYMFMFEGYGQTFALKVAPVLLFALAYAIGKKNEKTAKDQESEEKSPG